MVEAGEQRRVVRVLISGRVHGVGYRDWTGRNALALGLDGWVRNRSDGRVEAVFSGPAPAVARMVEKCRTGPSAATVTGVQEEGAEPPASGFAVLPTL